MSNTQNKRIDEIEDQIETLEGQLTRVRKVTPLHDATWYVKWFGVFFICMAVLCRSIQEVPKIYDVCFSIIGTEEGIRTMKNPLDQNDKILKAQELIKQKYTVEAIESEWVDVVHDQQ